MNTKLIQANHQPLEVYMCPQGRLCIKENAVPPSRHRLSALQKLFKVDNRVYIGVRHTLSSLRNGETCT